jgi:hypothetical protein
MVNRAWYVHCGRVMPDGLADSMRRDKAHKERWYREELMAACGVDTSLKLDPRRDFEVAMAHFEAIIGDNFAWQLKLFSGDRRRILFKIRDLSKQYDLDDGYIMGLARKALKRESTPDLDELVPEHLIKVLNAVRAHVRTLNVEVPF